MPPTNHNDALTVTELLPEELARAADIMAHAYRDNPLMFALFGDDPNVRKATNEVLLRARLAAMPQRPLAVRDSSGLIGVAGFNPPGGTEMSPENAQQIFEAFTAAGPDVMPLAMQLIAEFDRHKPAEPSWNLGPVGVDPARQGEGIGKTLVRAFCDLMDREGAHSHLETDVEANANLYARFGFETTARAPVHGVPMWFMSRHPQR